jgi:hypothetical protein
MVEYVIGLCFVKQIETGGATKILVDKVINNRNGSPALLVQGSDNYHAIFLFPSLNLTTF